MRTLSLSEMELVAGALIPISHGGSGGGSGSGSSGSGYIPYSASNPVFGNAQLQSMIDQSNLGGIITEHQMHIVEVQGATNSVTQCQTNTLEIPESLVNSYTAGQLFGQIAHEAGHMLYCDQYGYDSMLPSSYSTQGSYAQAQLTNEGWAQEQAIQSAISLVPNVNLGLIPGNQSLVGEEVQAYWDGVDGNLSQYQIAQNIGTIFQSQTLDNTSNGETYLQFYQNAWDANQTPMSY